MAVHVVRLTFVTEEACSRGELQVVAFVALAPEGLKVRIDVFARLCQCRRYAKIIVQQDVLVFTLELLGLVSAVLSGNKWAVIVTVIRWEDVV